MNENGNPQPLNSPSRKANSIKRTIDNAQSEWESLLRSPRNSDAYSPTKALNEELTANIGWRKGKKIEPGRKAKKEKTKTKWKEHRGPTLVRRNILQKDAQVQSSPDVETNRYVSAPRESNNPAQVPAKKTRDARIADLCDEDKGKLAKLIQQLVKVGSEHEQVMKDLEKERAEGSLRVERLREQNEKIAQESADLRKKFSTSLETLKTYQEKLIAVQQTCDTERKLRMEAESRIHQLQDETQRITIQAKQQQADIEVKALQNKREFCEHLKELEFKLREARERWRLERRTRLQEQQLNSLRLSQQMAQSNNQAENNPKKGLSNSGVSITRQQPEEPTSPGNIPEKVQIVLDEWTDRLKDALTASYNEKAKQQNQEAPDQNAGPPENSSTEATTPEEASQLNANDISVDIKPKPPEHPISPSAFDNMLRVKSPGSQISHSLSPHHAKRYATFKSKHMPSSPTRKVRTSTSPSTTRRREGPSRKTLSSRRSLPTTTNNKCESCARIVQKAAKKSQFSARPFAASSPSAWSKPEEVLSAIHDDTLDENADTEYHEMSLYDMVDHLEHDSSRISMEGKQCAGPHKLSEETQRASKPMEYDELDMGFRNTRGPLTSTELSLQQAVEQDMRRFLEEENFLDEMASQI